MELDLAPLTRQVKRKRLTREAAYRRRTELALRLLQEHGQLDRGPYSVLVTWGDIMPRDPAQETSRYIDQVNAGLKSHTGAMAALGQRDPDEEWAKAKRERAQWEQPSGSQEIRKLGS